MLSRLEIQNAPSEGVAVISCLFLVANNLKVLSFFPSWATIMLMTRIRSLTQNDHLCRTSIALHKYFGTYKTTRTVLP